MRSVGGVRPYLGGPRPLFRFRQPSGAAGHVGRVNVVHGGVPGHPRGVGGLEPVASTAMDARRLENIGDVFGIVDPIKLVFEFGGDIHLDEVDIVGHRDVTSCHTRCTIAMHSQAPGAHTLAWGANDFFTRPSYPLRLGVPPAPPDAPGAAGARCAPVQCATPPRASETGLRPARPGWSAPARATL